MHLPYKLPLVLLILLASLGGSAHKAVGAISMAAVDSTTLKEKYPNDSRRKLLGRISWQAALLEGGTNLAITTIATGVVLYAKSNKQFLGFAKHLRGKINKQGTDFLKRAGLDDTGIGVLLQKLKIRKIKVGNAFSRFNHLTKLSSEAKTLLSRKNWGETRLTRLNKDLANKTLRSKISEKPRLFDSWKKMDDLGADAALRKNPGALDALSKSKELRPNPSTYLSKDYIDNHLAKFDDGAVRFTTDKSPTLGTDEAFVMPKSEFDELMAKTGGDLSQIEIELALKEGTLTGGNAVIAWIKKADFSDIRMPSGREAGANPNKWIPGGKTADGGWAEAVMDLSDPGIPKTLFPF